MEYLKCFVCKAVGGVSVIVLPERSKGLDVGDWGMLNWDLGVWKFLFRLICIICLFISSVFWFWLMCLTLLRSCRRCEYILYVGLYSGSLKGAWRTTGSNGSDNRACLFSKVFGFFWKEMRVDQWRLWILVGLLDFLGTLLVGTGVGVDDLQFWKI